MANMGAVRKYSIKDTFSLLKAFESAKVYSRDALITLGMFAELVINLHQQN